MLKWKCSICGIDADYHLGEKNNHKYFCGKHWWENVIQNKSMGNVPSLVHDGKSIVEYNGIV